MFRESTNCLQAPLRTFVHVTNYDFLKTPFSSKYNPAISFGLRAASHEFAFENYVFTELPVMFPAKAKEIEKILTSLRSFEHFPTIVTRPNIKLET